MATYATFLREEGLDNTLKLTSDKKLRVKGLVEKIGTDFFVDATNGAAGRIGTSWDQALTTIDEAIGKCTANSGDRIICAPWHAETLTAATSLVMDIAGVELIGLIQGNQRPTLTLGTATTATVTVTGSNCRISGFKIISALADVAAGITASAAADGLVVDNCIFTDGGAALELVIGIQLAAACDGCKIINNEFYTVPTGGCASAVKLVGESSRTVIAQNIMQGDYSASCIDGTTAAATLLTIDRNIMVNIDTTAGSCVDLHNSTTAMVSNNRMMGGKSIADCIVGTGMATSGNYSTGAVNTSGILAEPTADAD